MRPILPKLKLGVDASGLPYRVPEEARLTFYYWPQVTVGFGAFAAIGSRGRRVVLCWASLAA